MKWILSLCLFSLFVFSSSGQETIYGEITHDNLEREYILYVPDSYDASSPVPLLLNFHGYTSNAWEQMVYGDFRLLADEHNFIIVHPEGTLDNNGITHFNVGWGDSTVDDVSFTERLIDYIVNNYSIDEDRIYSTGMSNGGFMSHGLACQLSNKIAAIASVTGAMSPPQLNSCNPLHPMPVMQIHGTSDLVVPYDGSAFSASVDEVMDYWISFNNLIDSPTTTPIADINTTDQSTVEHIVYSGGDNNVSLEHFKILNGGHTWPGTFINTGVTNYDINASEEIWKFFSRYDINGKTTSTEDKGISSNSSIFPNPTKGPLFTNLIGSEKYTLKSITGITLLSGEIENQEINISALPAGVYIITINGKSFKIIKN